MDSGEGDLVSLTLLAYTQSRTNKDTDKEIETKDGKDVQISYRQSKVKVQTKAPGYKPQLWMLTACWLTGIL